MFRQYKLFTRFIRYYKVQSPNGSKNVQHLVKFSPVPLLIGAQVHCVPKMSENNNSETNLEDDIAAALQQGEVATIKLMTQLKDFVVVASEEYRRCITKQVQIMKKATVLQAGPYSEAYDELPQFRTLANELKKQLTDYCTLFNTIVSMASDKDRINLNNHRKGEQLTEFQVLQKIVEQEVEKNSKCEKELLQAVTDNIINEILFDSPNY